jgi:ribosomal protein S18 acetylase RimI-like enzyme
MLMRKARSSDCERVGEVDVESFVHSPYGEPMGLTSKPEKREKRRQAAVNYCREHTSWVFVAEEEEEIVGFSTLDYWPEKQGGRIQNCCVLPDYRGRGIGTQLAVRAAEELKRLGARHIIVHTIHVPAARRTYEKAGFTLQKHEGVDYYYEMNLEAD